MCVASRPGTKPLSPELPQNITHVIMHAAKVPELRAVAELCFVIAAAVVVITVLHSYVVWPSLLLKASHLPFLWLPILQLFHKMQLLLSTAQEKSL